MEGISESEQWTPSKLRDLLYDPQYTTIISAAATSFLISALIHFPMISPSYYSDFMDSFWTRTNALGASEIVNGIPYVNYMFEYPPVAGFIVWVGGWGSHGSLFAYALIEFGILFTFAILTAHVIYQFLCYLGLGLNRQLVYSIFAPSLIFYGAYNFDIVQSFFIVLSLYFFVARSKQKFSAISLGLGIATKLTPILLLPLFILDIRGMKARVAYSGISLGVFAALNAPFMITNFNTWLSGYFYLKSWGLEDSFLVWIFPQSSWTVAKDISLVLLTAAIFSIYIFLRSKPLLVGAFMVMVAFVLFSYIAPPQMNIELLPLFSLVPLVPLSMFYLLELSNVAIILSWFEFSNQTLPGVTQTFALIRQIYLAFILGILVLSHKLSKT